MLITRKKLRDLARGQPCKVRLPDVCDGGGETTVGAHVPRGNVSGMGMKPPDLCLVYACARCHDVIDGRVPLPVWISPLELEAALLAALCRTLAYVERVLFDG